MYRLGVVPDIQLKRRRTTCRATIRAFMTTPKYVRPFPSLPPYRLDLFCAFVGDGDFALTKHERDRLYDRAGDMSFDGLWAEIESILHDRRVST